MTIKEIESQIANLSAAELAQFRVWYEQFDADVWDREIEQDVAAGRLSTLADEANAEFDQGNCEEI